MGSEDKFDKIDLCFTSNIEMDILDDILSSYGQLYYEESNSLVESERMGNEDKFNETDLCFTSNIETNIFNDILDSYRQLCFEKSNNLVESETKTDFDLTDSEKGLYFLTKGQSFANWKDVK
ncbi:21682_t:CDS:1, partial [Racocetra persica]